jgi:hypothetical protein
VNGAQQPREIVCAQLGTRGRRAVIPPHTYDRATPFPLPVRANRYQSQ